MKRWEPSNKEKENEHLKLSAAWQLYMTPLGWSWVGFMWGYAVLWFLVNDRVKLLAYRFFDPDKVKSKSEANPEAKAETKAEVKADPNPEAEVDLKSERKPSLGRFDGQIVKRIRKN